MPRSGPSSASSDASGFRASLTGETDAARALALALRDLDIVQRRIRRLFASRMNLSPVEFNAVMLIAEAGEVTPKTISTELNLTPGAVTAMLDRLEAADLVRRWPHPTDRRSLVLTLGAAGEVAKKQVYSDYTAAVAETVVEHDGLRDPLISESIATIAASLSALTAETTV